MCRRRLSLSPRRASALLPSPATRHEQDEDRGHHPAVVRRPPLIEEARAIADNPALLKLRELEALGEMAKAGGKFVIGLKPEGVLGDGGERKS